MFDHSALQKVTALHVVRQFLLLWVLSPGRTQRLRRYVRTECGLHAPAAARPRVQPVPDVAAPAPPRFAALLLRHPRTAAEAFQLISMVVWELGLPGGVLLRAQPSSVQPAAR